MRRDRRDLKLTISEVADLTGTPESADKRVFSASGAQNFNATTLQLYVDLFARRMDSLDVQRCGICIPANPGVCCKKECVRQAQLIKARHRAGKRKIKVKTEKTQKDLIQDYVDALPADRSPATIRGYKKKTNKNATSRRIIPITISELSAAIAAIPEDQRSGLISIGNVNAFTGR